VIETRRLNRDGSMEHRKFGKEIWICQKCGQAALDPPKLRDTAHKITT